MRPVKCFVFAPLAFLLIAAPVALGQGPVLPKPKAWIGVALGQPRLEDKTALRGTSYPKGCARVDNVLAGTPAFDAGILHGDFICEVNGKKVSDSETLIATIKTYEVGSVVNLRVLREKKSLDFKMVLAPRPGDGEEYLRQAIVGKVISPIKIETWVGNAPPSQGKLAGKVTLLDFWEPWCGPCRETVPWLNTMHDKYGKKDLQIFGIASEPFEDLAAAREKLGMKYFIGFDKNSEIKSKYLVMAIPTMLLIDKTGKLVDIKIGGGDHSEFERKIEELMK